VKAYPSPCILLQAELALNKEEALAQSQTGFGFHKGPKQSLRAVHVTVNTAAREMGLQFFEKWRVPPNSVIADVFANGGYAEADEDLDWWSASSGKRLASQPVCVKAKRTWDSVQALLIPIIKYSLN
jgi:hypothetical protein